MTGPSLDLAPQPLATASALHPRFYLGDAAARLDRDAVFARHWQYLCHVSQLGDDADPLMLTLGTLPVTVARTADGLRGLQAVCLHRAGPLDPCRGGGRRFLRCRYHAWSYELDGRLLDAPEMRGAEGFDPATLRLPALELREFAGRQPSGLRDPGPASGPDALDAVAEAGFRYLAGCLHDDVPVPLKTAHGLLWSVPCRGPTGELAPVPGPLDADVFAQTACDHFDRLWHEADEEDEALVCCLPLDPRLIGQPHAVGALRRVLDQLCGHDFVWHAQAGALVEAAQRSHEGHADFEAWLREGRS